MVATVTDDPGRGCVQDLREPAFHRVLTVIKSLDLLAAERAQLEQLIHQGLTTQVRRGWGGVKVSPPTDPPHLPASGAALVRGSASRDHP